MRPTRTGIIAVLAMCQDCGWSSEARNALGNAAQHHDRTGHTVHVEQTLGVIYGDASKPPPGQTVIPS